MSVPLDQLIRSHWWAAVATLCRLTGDLGAAEEAVQAACVVAGAVAFCGVPDNALGWLIGVARHKAVDRLRREAVRAAKEAASVRETGESAAGLDASPQAADTLDPDARRAARSDDLGDLVLLEDQDRRRWDQDMIAEGEAILEAALGQGGPGPISCTPPSPRATRPHPAPGPPTGGRSRCSTPS